MEASAVDDDSVNETMEIFTQEDFENVAKEENRGTSLSKEIGDKPKDGKEDVGSSGSIANDEIDIDEDEIDDDGESSVDSDSSSQSGSSLSSMASTSSEASLTLMQRQARNIVRNERFLGSLQQKYKGQLPENSNNSKENSTQNGKQPSIQSTSNEISSDKEDGDCRAETNLGMVRKGTHRLFRFVPPRALSGQSSKTTSNNENDVESQMLTYPLYASGIQHLNKKYPHREAQIRTLHAILSSTVSLTASISTKIISSSAASVYVPAPIFCMGTRGTGKTSVVCDLLGLLGSRQETLCNNHIKDSPFPHQARVKPAYVDCSIVEPSTIERLVYTIYNQLKPSSGSMTEDSKPKATKPKSKHKSKSKKQKLQLTSLRPPPEPSQTQLEDSNGGPNDLRTAATAQHSVMEHEEANQPRVLPSRRAKKAAVHKSIASNATTYRSVKRRREGGYNSSDDDDDDDDDDSDEEAVTTLHSAVLSLGRSLQRYYGSYLDDNGAYNNRGFHKKPKCAILVLDKAEELLSLASGSKKGTSATSSGANNYLSELLLLPKIMKLNLTIVVITNYCTLHMTREFFFGIYLVHFIFGISFDVLRIVCSWREY